MAIQGSLQTSYLNNSEYEASSSSFVPSVFVHGGTSQTDTFESSRSQTRIGQNVRSSAAEVSFPAISGTASIESSFGYIQDVESSNGLSNLTMDSFPPLPGVSRNVKKKSKKSGSNSFAESIIKKGLPRPKMLYISPSTPSTSKSVSSTISTVAQVKSAKKNQSAPPNQIGNPWNNMPSSSNRLSTHNANTQLHSSKQAMHVIDDVQIANNKSLVNKIRVELGKNKDRFAAFKKISGEFRHGVIGTAEYLSYVLQFELSHLTIELAQLCPDLRKQKELIDTYNANILYHSISENVSKAKKGI